MDEDLVISAFERASSRGFGEIAGVVESLCKHLGIEQDELHGRMLPIGFVMGLQEGIRIAEEQHS